MPEPSQQAQPEVQQSGPQGDSLRLANHALKMVNQRARQATHERDEALKKVKALNKALGRLGETVCHLRGELARARDENSKIERGHLRWLERQVEILREQVVLDGTRLQSAYDTIEQLRARPAPAETEQQPAPATL